MERSDDKGKPSFGAAAKFWLKLGLISFGGPGAQISLMHAELVEKKKWISEARFLHALSFCMILPGPEAQQLATYIGWLLHRTWGGIVAGGLFILPSALIMLGLSWVYVVFGSVPQVEAVFHGLKPAVLAIVSVAVIRLGMRTLKSVFLWLVAGGAFGALFLLHVPFPGVVAGAAVIGWIARGVHAQVKDVEGSGGEDNEDFFTRDDGVHTVSRFLLILASGLLLWWGPIFVLAAFVGGQHALVQEGVFFSKAAMVTFGGAYAVLPYVSQQAVANFGWLSTGQMMDGLGLAETTPGPLIMVLQFVGFIGGWNHHGDLSPLLAAMLGALLTTWVTFVPCFLWIFLGAPYMERLRGIQGLASVLAAVTAAIVGVIANLAVWFGLHIFFPQEGAWDWFAVGVTMVAVVGLIRWKWNVVLLIGGAALIGLFYGMISH